MSQYCCTPMGTCNEEKAVITQTNLCPTCGQKGKKVDSITFKAWLDISLLTLRDVRYLFCPTAACPVVYFAADRLQFFTKEQVRVHQKEPDDESVLVCYCFYHSPQTIRIELLARNASNVVEKITGGIQAGQCACKVRNPQGSCCLVTCGPL